jgi:ankyrin repeat protein
LCIAAEAGCVDVVALLLRCGADIDQGNSNGLTPLQAAAIRGHTAVVKELLQRGASLDAGTSDWHTACVIIAKSALRHWIATPEDMPN